MSRLRTRRDLLQAAAVHAPGALLLNAGCRSTDHGTEPPAPGPRPPVALDARAVSFTLDATPTLEGAGVRLRRSIGTRELSFLDPFLLLDEIHSDRVTDYAAGFPTHPHRGFETVTYMLSGVMEHRDSLGNGGQLFPGSAQWMTAGHGIVHSEMPRPDGNPFWGLQLWVNLPRTDKLVRPRYQNIVPDSIPVLGVQGAELRLVAGTLGRERGPVAGISVEPSLLDVRLPARGRFDYELPREHTVFAYVLEGEAELGASRSVTRASQLAVFGPGQVVVARSSGGARFLLIAGRKLAEPVARRGPFVMNTQAELAQAYADYENGTLVSG